MLTLQILTLIKKYKCCLLLVALAQILIAGNVVAQCVDDVDCGEAATCVEGACQEALVGPTTDVDSSTEVSADASSVPVQKERIKPLWLGGLITFSTIYVATIVGNAVLSDADARGESVAYALIPLAGPFISLGNESDDTEIKPEFKGIMVVSGILQILGAGAFTAGMIIKREPKKTASLNSPKWWLTPAPIGTSGAGGAFTLTHL